MLLVSSYTTDSSGANHVSYRLPLANQIAQPHMAACTEERTHVCAFRDFSIVFSS